ncbi:winged helix-turn-helix transcriptional regulator [Phytohabitans houttuyneae]|uniref:Transcriptional regulator n=1 Tax=Phytohabitans houttuyneae TaxID=1076126 RepID=A0A6V8KQX5_9ACTN|nr:winged helix-turn-helix transcriptional regulator [Phytohabitans houttuyneae]GFJ86244.1 transcriptional regulator [Phytohabitans houttuyneae]
MVGKRGYNDGCALSHGLDLVGERWALLVVRELLLGPKRFTDLQSDLPGVSADVLTQRLRDLQAAGLVVRRRLGPPAPAWVYELTDWGAELGPVVTDLARWASRSPALPVHAPISASSLILSLRALFDPDAAAGFTATVALRLGVEEFTVRITAGTFDIVRGGEGQPDVTFLTDTETLTGLLHEGLSLGKAHRSGRLELTGDWAVAERFRTLFPLPTPVAVT